MKKPLNVKVKIDKNSDPTIGPIGYYISNRPVITNVTENEIEITEIKRDWIKEIRSLLGLEGGDQL